MKYLTFLDSMDDTSCCAKNSDCDKCWKECCLLCNRTNCQVCCTTYWTMSDEEHEKNGNFLLRFTK